MMQRIFLYILLSLFILPASGQSARFRGAAGDGVYQESGLLKSWPEGGPECVLTVEGLGKGHSTPVVVNETIYVTGMTDGKDHLTALRMDGTVKWRIPYGNSWTRSFPDTRSTPTIEGNRIYLLSGTGKLTCADTLNGHEIWSAETDTDFESQWHKWGVAESILIVDNLVISTPAGKKAAVVAYDKLTGKVVWQSRPTEGQRSYASAILYQGDGFRLLLASTTTELIALVPETGEIVWVHKHWQADRDANGDSGHIFTNTPTIQGRDVFLTRGYNYPCIMLTISSDGKSVQEKWSNGILDNHHHGVSCVDGYIYGSNWLSNAQGNWVCLDWNTGEMKWEQPWNNKGPIIQADGMLYIMDEKSGNFGLLAPDPGGFNLVSTFRIEKGTGPYWSHPSIYDGRLYVRHGEVLMVYRIK